MCGGLRIACINLFFSFYHVGSWGLNSSYQVLQQAPLSAEPSCWPLLELFFLALMIVWRELPKHLAYKKTKQLKATEYHFPAREAC